MKFFNKYSLLSVALASTIGLFGCGEADKASNQQAQASAPEQPKVVVTEIKLGVVGENNDAWEHVAKVVKDDNIKLTLVKFADYTLPNGALNNGEIDLNAFQHVAFLNSEIADKKFELTRIANTIISPLGIYSQKIKSVDELKDGDLVAIPNDATNGGRAIKLVEAAGLIKVDPSKGFIPTVRDITENPKNLKFYEVDAGNTARLLPDVAVSIINGDFAVDNGLVPQKDAIFLENVGEATDDNPYINIIAARTKDQNRPEFQKIIKAFQTKETAEIILRVRKGAEIPAFKY